ncbi:hypothetical protein L218DRAFT_1009961 [Marasmius fiardii PR-910]|nr:hypothetical protein L218DRAFT_1009961 [Marasmius fiardii PR-910]
MKAPERDVTSLRRLLCAPSYVQTMTTDDFLDIFLGVDPGGKPLDVPHLVKEAVTKSQDLDEPSYTIRTETEAYKPLIEALKPHCPALQLENTGSHSETITWDGHSLTIKPDITAYHSSNQPKEKTDLSRAEFLFELKTNNSDPFSNIDTGRPNTITSPVPLIRSPPTPR